MSTLQNSEPARRPTGMTGFLFIWIGQIVSVLASGMSGFALTIFMFQQTRSATAMGLMQVAYILPFLLLSPVAGVMVDRYNRKLMMAVSDLGAVTATFGILLLQYFGVLQYWHLYVASVVYGLGNTFQWPAYSAAISTMVNKEQYGRANGLMTLMEAGPGVISPLLAGALLPLIKLDGILLIDVLTFFFALAALMVVVVPQPVRSSAGAEGSQGGMLKQATFGFRYIFQRPSLLGLQMTFFFANLFAGMAMTVVAPMILLRTNDNSAIFGAVQSAGAIGAVAGGIVMSIWGGFKRRVHGILAGWMVTGVFMALFGASAGLVFWITFFALQSLVGPLVNTSSQSIWQAKVPQDLQGRVFSARRLIAWFTQPIAPLVAGLLADRWLEPAMSAGVGFLPSSFRWLVGAEAGSGMALLIVLCGAAAGLVGLAGYFNPYVRNAETILPDHDAEPAVS